MGGLCSAAAGMEGGKEGGWQESGSPLLPPLHPCPAPAGWALELFPEVEGIRVFPSISLGAARKSGNVNKKENELYTVLCTLA